MKERCSRSLCHPETPFGLLAAELTVRLSHAPSCATIGRWVGAREARISRKRGPVPTRARSGIRVAVFSSTGSRRNLARCARAAPGKRPPPRGLARVAWTNSCSSEPKPSRRFERRLLHGSCKLNHAHSLNPTIQTGQSAEGAPQHCDRLISCIAWHSACCRLRVLLLPAAAQLVW